MELALNTRSPNIRGIGYILIPKDLHRTNLDEYRRDSRKIRGLSRRCINRDTVTTSSISKQTLPELSFIQTKPA